MSKTQELEEALNTIEELCTTEQIKELLRQSKKEDDEVKISAEKKHDLVHVNLKAAVEAKLISLESLFGLIRASEENGNQHVFYYKASRQLAATLSYQQIGQRIWGDNYSKKLETFPSAKVVPNSYRVADFRGVGQNKPNDWILKIYGHAFVARATGEEEERATNRLWREFIVEPLRIVLVARWNSPDLLEIRVQRNESRRRIESWEEEIWKTLGSALVKSQFSPWVLRKQMGRLITENEKNALVYTFRDASLIDKTGVHATFQTESDQGSLFASEETKSAVKNYMDSESECSGLTITWLQRGSTGPKKQLRTLLGSKASNEMIVFGHCYSGDLDYVTDQLRYFGA